MLTEKTYKKVIKNGKINLSEFNNVITCIIVDFPGNKIPKNTFPYMTENEDGDFDYMTLEMNGHKRLNYKEPNYYKYWQPYMGKLPSSYNHSYAYTFSTDPTNHKINSGSIDLSRLNSFFVSFIGAKEGTEVDVSFITILTPKL